MKKLSVLFFIAVLIASTVSAQGIRDQQDENIPQTGNEVSRQSRGEQRREIAPQTRGERKQEAAPQARGDRRQEVTPQKKCGKQPKFNPQSRNDRRQSFAPQSRNDRRPGFAPQSRNQQKRDVNPQLKNNSQNMPKPEAVTLNGTLKLEKGFVAMQTQSENNPVVLVPMLNRFIGFISGLTEGVNVSVEGFRFRNMVHPTKLTIGDRTYDFPVRPNINRQ